MLLSRGMDNGMGLLSGDGKLLQIVDGALADAAARSGRWLACRPGCSQCCHGAFAINQLDALRLRAGLEAVAQTDPLKAARIRERAAVYVRETWEEFPGDPQTGTLGEDDEAQTAFEGFANERPCPALDPQSQTCDLYKARPMTCRIFGPPVRGQEGLGVCELCFVGATPEEIGRCEMVPDPDGLEDKMLELVAGSVFCNEYGAGNTIVAYALENCVCTE